MPCNSRHTLRGRRLFAAEEVIHLGNPTGRQEAWYLRSTALPVTNLYNVPDSRRLCNYDNLTSSVFKRTHALHCAVTCDVCHVASIVRCALFPPESVLQEITPDIFQSRIRNTFRRLSANANVYIYIRNSNKFYKHHIMLLCIRRTDTLIDITWYYGLNVSLLLLPALFVSEV